jgi:bifunctional NMN adenylyltransferase/nudix hydrolase
MKEKTVKTDCGIIVARFHLHELHEAHKDLIQSVINRHERTIIFLGLSPLKNTENNPLEFKHRKAMIEERFSDVEIHYIDDNRDDIVWSTILDKQIRKWLNPTQTATLYGSRDSFLKCYHGKFPTCELESEIFVSATEIRRKIINSYPPTKDFRAGLIAGTGLRFPTAYQTVDGAIINDKGDFLMAQKPGETKWRFIGGFSDPRSTSLEMDIVREIKEEAGNIEVSEPHYLGSTLIDDWRYRKEKDKIKTAFFIVKFLWGSPTGGDDIESVKWFHLKDMTDKNIVPEHIVLVKMLVEKFINNKVLMDTLLPKNEKIDVVTGNAIMP